MPPRKPGQTEVTVVLPTYNRASTLRRAISSVLRQTFEDFELIVVDDASTDTTKEVVQAFDDSRLSYIRLPQNGGGGAARNAGIQAARGDYIAFQDSDDEWLPTKLERQMKLFRQADPTVGVVYCSSWKVAQTGNVSISSQMLKHKQGYVYRDLLWGNFIDTPTAIVKAQCFKTAGLFDKCLPQLQDWDLFLRISQIYEIRYLEEPLIISHFSTSGISANVSAYLPAMRIIVAKHLTELNRNRRLMSKQFCSIGSLSWQAGEPDARRNFLLPAVRANPLNLKCLAVCFLSFFPWGHRFYLLLKSCKNGFKNLRMIKKAQDLLAR